MWALVRAVNAIAYVFRKVNVKERLSLCANLNEPRLRIIFIDLFIIIFYCCYQFNFQNLRCGCFNFVTCRE